MYRFFQKMQLLKLTTKIIKQKYKYFIDFVDVVKLEGIENFL